MYKIILAAAVIAAPLCSQAQFGNLINKVKNKVNARVDSKVDKAIDKTLDEAEGKGQPATTQAPAATEQKQEATGIKSYAKYDFVPGDKIVYSNDFAAESMGELPIGWNSSGNGAVAIMEGVKGNWVQLYKTTTYLTDNKQNFTDNFTVEFDLVIRRSNPKASFPQLAFGVLSSGDLSTTSNELLKSYTSTFATELKIQPSDYNGSHMHLETFQAGQRYLNTDVKPFAALEKLFNTPVHIAMQFQKERMRIWINELKMYDLPKAVAEGTVLNQLYFLVKNGNSADEEVGYNIGNIKIAVGLPDTRHKLIEEGKFSTTGILFDVNSATIKPESNGVLKEIADVLQKFPEVKVKITGHTDSDGSDNANLELSKKRAEAVKQSLASDYGIDASRMQFDGKGETVPVGDNKTKEGKAQNRRVEFEKM